MLSLWGEPSDSIEQATRSHHSRIWKRDPYETLQYQKHIAFFLESGILSSGQHWQSYSDHHWTMKWSRRDAIYASPRRHDCEIHDSCHDQYFNRPEIFWETNESMSRRWLCHGPIFSSMSLAGILQSDNHAPTSQPLSFAVHTSKSFWVDTMHSRHAEAPS